MSQELKIEIVPVVSLSEESIEEMVGLFEKYYVDTSEQQFRSDLFEKTHVFLFRSGVKIIGFSTIFRKQIPSVGPGLFLFSGDTVLEENFWGTKILQKAFFRYIVQSKFIAFNKPVYWMLISKGYKTYLMMRRNFKCSYPQADVTIPSHVKDIMNKFYHWKYGEAYNTETGIITFTSPRGSVKGSVADPAQDQLNVPEIKYFLQHNPEYKRGDELACIAEIKFSDFFQHIGKYFIRKK